jgi:hypothetical protein
MKKKKHGISRGEALDTHVIKQIKKLKIKHKTTGLDTWLAKI